MRLVKSPAFLISAAVVLGTGLLLAAGGAAPVRAGGDTAVATHAPEHDLYNPARAALVNARRQLAETFRQEQDILEQRRRVHRELDASLKLLADAEQLDPSMSAPIEGLRERISVLESDPCATQFDGETLKELYDRLLADFEALIEHY
jgi:hypothetical protein